jgi:hypothetical protein
MTPTALRTTLVIALMANVAASCAPSVTIADKGGDGDEPATGGNGGEPATGGNGGEPASGGSGGTAGTSSNGGSSSPGGSGTTGGSDAGSAGEGQGGTGGEGDPVDADGDGYPVPEDCDDENPEIHPGAVERCDSIDDDCDPSTDAQGDVGPGRTHTSIQDAIDSTTAGDTIEVCPGTYVEPLLVHKNLTLLGVGGPSVTIIDGVSIQPASAVLVTTGVTATIQGFTITRGSGHRNPGRNIGAGGGGITNLGSLAVRNCLVTANSVTGHGFGGGILNLGNMSIESSEISENSVDYWGAGIANGEPNEFPATKLVIRNSLIANNDSNDSCGGLNDLSTELLEVYDSDFVDNTAGGIGGGLCDRYGTARIENTTIRRNSASSQWGGGLWLMDLDYELGGIDVADNSAPIGGGIYSSNARGTFESGSVLRNQATGSLPVGPGAWLGSGSQLAAMNVDFGAGADDNIPSTSDIFIDGGNTSHAYGADATFTCSASGCQR